MRSDAQKKADKKYNQGLKVLSCKISKDKAEQIEEYIKENNYKSINNYIKFLITKDSGIEL